MRCLSIALLFLFSSAAAAQGTLLAVYNTLSRIDVVNSANGASISQTALTSSQTIFGFTGLAQDPTTGTLYAAVRTSGTAADIYLGTINRSAGTVTLIGEFNVAGTGESISNIQFDGTGQLWAISGVAVSGTPNPETLFTVNKATAALAVFQALGNSQPSEALGFDPTNSTVMYHYTGQSTKLYETVNLTTGATTPITISNPPTTNKTILCMAYDSNSAWFWTCTDATGEYGYIRPTGQYVAFGTMAALAKGMVVLPTVFRNPSSVSLGTTTQGTAGTAQNFTLSGSNLFGDVTVTAPTGVEVSLSAASGYATSLNVPRSSVSGQLTSTQIFVRISSGASVGSFTSNVDLTATGADTVQVGVTGQVNGPPAPEMDVTRNAAAIADNGGDAVGDFPAGVAQTLTYVITNSGNATLNMSNAVIGALNNCNVNITSQVPATLAATLTDDLVLSVTAQTAAGFSFTVSIGNDDTSENPYNWTVTGTGVPNAPEMDVFRGATPIASGSNDAAGNRTTGTAFSLTYDIDNTGPAALALTVPVVPTGNLNCTATVTSQPSANVASLGTTTLVLSVTPTADGPFSFSISIDNDDANEDPYDFVVSGAASTSGGNNGVNGGDDGGDCSTDTGSTLALLALLFALVGAFVARRRPA